MTTRDPTALRVARARPPRPLHERLVRIHDEEVYPVWNARFERLLRAGLPASLEGAVLEVGCGTGSLTAELLRRHQGPGRIVALDSSPALLDEARTRLGQLGLDGGGRIFLRLLERRRPDLGLVLPFAEETFLTTLAHLGPGEAHAPALAAPAADSPPASGAGSEASSVPWQATLRELARVTVPGGQLVSTLPLAGSYLEVLDLLDEVLLEVGAGPDTRDRLTRYRQAQPEGPAVVAAAEAAGLTDVEVDLCRWELLFKSGRELFYAPVIEQGPLAAWKEVVAPAPPSAEGKVGPEQRARDDEMQAVFSALKQAIDTYAGGESFAVTVVGGRISGRKAAEVTQP